MLAQTRKVVNEEKQTNLLGKMKGCGNELMGGAVVRETKFQVTNLGTTVMVEPQIGYINKNLKRNI